MAQLLKGAYEFYLKHFFEEGTKSAAQAWLKDPHYYRLIRIGLREEEDILEAARKQGQEDLERYFEWMKRKKYFQMIVDEAHRIDPELAKSLGNAKHRVKEMEITQKTVDDFQQYVNDLKKQHGFDIEKPSKIKAPKNDKQVNKGSINKDKIENSAEYQNDI